MTTFPSRSHVMKNLLILRVMTKTFYSRVKKLSWEDELAAYNGGQVIIVVMDTSMMINMIIDHGHYSQA